MKHIDAPNPYYFWKTLKKDFVYSYLSEGIVLIAGLLIFKIVAYLFGSKEFSAFALARRNISLLLPAMMLGLSVGIPRYMAIANSSGRASNCSSYAAGGGILILIVLSVFSVFIFVLKEKAAFLLFGSTKYSDFIMPIIIMLFGLTAFTWVYSCFRGKSLFVYAGIFKAINLGILPLASCFFATKVIQQMIIQGSTMIVCSMLVLIFINKLFIAELKAITPCAKELVRYSVPRVPGDFCISGIAAIPAIVCAHFYGVEKAGIVAFGITIMNLLGLAFAPLGLILLPKVSELFAVKNIEKIQVYIKRLIWISLISGVVFFLTVNLFAEDFIEIVLGSSNKDKVQIIRITMFASLFLPLYVSLRSIIDAIYERSVNTFNIYKVSLFMAVALSPLFYFQLTINYVLFVFSLTYLALGVLTLRDTGLIYKKINNDT